MSAWAGSATLSEHSTAWYAPPAGDGAADNSEAGRDDQSQQREGADGLGHDHGRADAGEHLCRCTGIAA